MVCYLIYSVFDYSFIVDKSKFTNFKFLRDLSGDISYTPYVVQVFLENEFKFGFDLHVERAVFLKIYNKINNEYDCEISSEIKFS